MHIITTSKTIFYRTRLIRRMMFWRRVRGGGRAEEHRIDINGQIFQKFQLNSGQQQPGPGMTINNVGQALI